MGKNYRKTNQRDDRRGKGGKSMRSKYTAGADKAVSFDALKSNDVSWYNKNPIQFNLATKTPTWAQIQGAPYKGGSTLFIADVSENIDQTKMNAEIDNNSVMAGIMAIDYMPTIGITESAVDPVNKAFNLLMSELYARTSGSSLNFQQADLAMMITSLSSLASLFASAKRALGTKDFWITRNKNYPRLLFRAMGFYDSAYDDMVENYNAYVSRLQNLIAQFNAIKIPGWFDIFKRHYSLAHNVYLDEDSDFGQIYIFRPTGYWQYIDIEGFLDYNSISIGTISDLLDEIEEGLSSWLNSSDLYTMNGALLRAFGNDGNFIFVEDFNPGTKIDPIIDKNILMQVMNATIVNGIDSSEARITQSPDQNLIVSTISLPELENEHHVYKMPDGWLMRAFSETVSADDNMEMSRLTVTFNKDNTIESCGSEIVTQIHIFRYGYDVQTFRNNAVMVTALDYPSNELATRLGYLSPFRYLPRFTYVFTDPWTDQWSISEINDQYNYCAISREDLRNMHTAALFSLWKPQISGIK